MGSRAAPWLGRHRHVNGILPEPATHGDDADVRGPQVLLAPVDDDSHALLDGEVLLPRSFDAGEGQGPLRPWQVASSNRTEAQAPGLFGAALSVLPAVMLTKMRGGSLPPRTREGAVDPADWDVPAFTDEPPSC